MKEVLQVAYLRHLQDFYLFESVKDGIIAEKADNSYSTPLSHK